ncbi:MAG: extracellular solute-binding protein [Chloroflexi bacterium]|nr:MAG: extracellular solute-binding protein [Chloroflexota bacterium]MBL1196442.1 extracellular solute-binding protein [Chloroflexota bacterium]NOH13737.1 extracellular solute-binding protein [Chloroflexota bacterium]
MPKRLYLLLILVLLLAACAGPAVEEPPAPVEEPEVEEPAPVEEEAEPAEEMEEEEMMEEVSMRFFIPDGGGRPDGYNSVIDAYREIHPNVTIELDIVPFGDYYGQLPVMWASDNPADLALVDSADIQSQAYNGALAPLDDIFTEEDMADFRPGVVSEASLDGVLYAAPFGVTTQGVFYNVDMFEAAGIEPPREVDDAWTWSEYIENTQAVIANEAANGNEDVWGVVYLTNPPNIDMWTHLVVRSFGEKDSPTFAGISPDGTTSAGYLDTPEAFEAYEFWQSLYVDLEFAPQATVPDAFQTNKAATMISFAAWGSVLDIIAPDLNWGVTPLPYQVTPITQMGDFTPVVSANGSQVEEAKAFMQFLASTEGVLAYNAATNMIPARISVLDQLDAFSEYPNKIFVDEMIAWGVPRPETPGHAIYNSIFGKMMVDIAQGADIQAAVEAAVLEIDAQLAQFE